MQHHTAEQNSGGRSQLKRALFAPVPSRPSLARAHPIGPLDAEAAAAAVERAVDAGFKAENQVRSRAALLAAAVRCCEAAAVACACVRFVALLLRQDALLLFLFIYLFIFRTKCTSPNIIQNKNKK